MNLQPLARMKIGAAFFTPASNSASMPGLTSICAISRIMAGSLGEVVIGSGIMVRASRSEKGAVAVGMVVLRLSTLLRRLLIRYVDKAAGLATPQCGVMTVAPQQLFMRALFDDSSAVEHDQPVHLCNRRQTVGNGDDGAALHKSAKARLDRGFNFAVERRRR